MYNNKILNKTFVLNNAIASVGIEGYDTTRIDRELCMTFLDNKITREELVKINLERFNP